MLCSWVVVALLVIPCQRVEGEDSSNVELAVCSWYMPHVCFMHAGGRLLRARALQQGQAETVTIEGTTVVPPMVAANTADVSATEGTDAAQWLHDAQAPGNVAVPGNYGATSHQQDFAIPNTASTTLSIDAWDAAPACTAAPTAANSVRDNSGRLWGWENQASCAYKSGSTPLYSYGTAPGCGPTATKAAYRTKDATGSVWGWEDGHSCLFRVSHMSWLW